MKDLKNDKLIELITNIINKSLNNGKVPDKMKVAVIRPLFKQGKHKITELQINRKNLETIVHNQLSKFININKIISTKQFGFQKYKSAESCLSEFTEYVNGLLHKNKEMLILFIDFSKAFDLLSHEIIINNFKKIGV